MELYIFGKIMEILKVETHLEDGLQNLVIKILDLGTGKSVTNLLLSICQQFWKDLIKVYFMKMLHLKLCLLWHKTKRS